VRSKFGLTNEVEHKGCRLEACDALGDKPKNAEKLPQIRGLAAAGLMKLYE